MTIDQIIPGTGWEITRGLDTPNPRTTPVAAFGLTSGVAVALEHTPDGILCEFNGNGETEKLHPEGMKPLPVARLIAIAKHRDGWDFEIRCPRCRDTHLHGAGKEKSREAFLNVLGKRAAHCPQQSFSYVMADPDCVIAAFTPARKQPMPF